MNSFRLQTTSTIVSVISVIASLGISLLFDWICESKRIEIDWFLNIMSKTDFKKYLQQLPKEEVINIVLEYYSKSKEAKNYFDYMLAPDVTKKLEECKKVILNEYYPKRGWGNARISVGKKAISDFTKLKPGDEMLAEAMVCLIETACQYTWDYGDRRRVFTPPWRTISSAR